VATRASSRHLDWWDRSARPAWLRPFTHVEVVRHRAMQVRTTWECPQAMHSSRNRLCAQPGVYRPRTLIGLRSITVPRVEPSCEAEPMPGTEGLRDCGNSFLPPIPGSSGTELCSAAGRIGPERDGNYSGEALNQTIESDGESGHNHFVVRPAVGPQITTTRNISKSNRSMGQGENAPSVVCRPHEGRRRGIHQRRQDTSIERRVRTGAISTAGRPWC